jgi:hypothetical protein
VADIREKAVSEQSSDIGRKIWSRVRSTARLLGGKLVYTTANEDTDSNQEEHSNDNSKTHQSSVKIDIVAY